VFTDEKTAFLNYAQQGTGHSVQKSTDGGFTYGPFQNAGSAGGRIGPLRAILSPDKDPAKATVYFPSYQGSMITLTMSHDGGDSWGTCSIYDAEASPSAGFVIADHDSAGNIYVAYSEKGAATGRDTYYTYLPAAQVPDCKTGESFDGVAFRLNRDKVDTTVMPWLVAGDEGRIAVAYFGTDTDGNPDEGCNADACPFRASWFPMVTMTTNALAAKPSFSQVHAIDHPFHYNSICLGGLGCDLSVPKGDRSLADYFAMDLNPTDGRLYIVYGSSAKKPSDDLGHVSTATVVRQETGPSLLGGTLKAIRPGTRNETVDPKGDALAAYSNLFVAGARNYTPALDILDVKVGPEIDLADGKKAPNGGLTVTIKVAALDDDSLTNALTASTSQSLIYLFRFLNGFQPAGATMAWSPATGFTFGFDDFTTRSTESGQYDPTAEKIIVWPQKVSIPGRVNQDAGLIQFSIPRKLLRAQTGSTGKNSTPTEVPATDGSRIPDVNVFTMGNSFTPVQADQSYLYPVDGAPASEVILGQGPAVPPAKPGGPSTLPGGNTGGSSGGSAGGGTGGNGLPSTGGLGWPAAALAVSIAGLGGWYAVRRRRVATR
jgi:hypothetical protein